MAVKLVTDSALNKAMNMLTGDRDMILNVYDPAAGRRQVAFSDDLPTAEEKAAWNDSDVFIATYGTTTSAEIEAAYQAGKAVYCKMPETALIFNLTSRNSEYSHYFMGLVHNGNIVSLNCNTDTWVKLTFPGMVPKKHASTHASGGSDALYGLYTADTDPTTNNFINWTYE